MNNPFANVNFDEIFFLRRVLNCNFQEQKKSFCCIIIIAFVIAFVCQFNQHMRTHWNPLNAKILWHSNCISPTFMHNLLRRTLYPSGSQPGVCVLPGVHDKSQLVRQIVISFRFTLIFHWKCLKYILTIYKGVR